MDQDTSLAGMLKAQRDLQIDSFGVDPCELTGEDRVRFLDWNLTALADELHELRGEVGWKPWASSRHVNAEEAFGEAVDAWHFFMNILWTILGDGTEIAIYGSDLVRHPSEALASAFADRYYAKRQRNAERQEEGYDGVTGKCPDCKRDRKETEHVLEDANVIITYCLCGKVLTTELKTA